MSGWWLQDDEKSMQFGETFHQLIETLDVDKGNTYVAIGYGDCGPRSVASDNTSSCEPQDHFDQVR